MDVERFAPREPARPRPACARWRAPCGARRRARRRARGGASAFARDELQAAAALERLDPDRDVLVAYVGKLIVSKGVDLLVAAWPLVLEQVPRARLVVVGFGAYRDGLERLLDALGAGDLDAAREIARAGRALEGEAPARRAAAASPAGLPGRPGGRASASATCAAAGMLGERVVLTGRLDHEELAELLPACEALVVPSTFPEAFGMVAAEAAACGALPVSAAHSGLAEVSEELAARGARGRPAMAVLRRRRGAVQALAACLHGWLGADPELRAQARRGLVGTVRERWSWEGVASGVIAAARGELDGLREP